MLSVPFGNLIGFYASRFATVFVVFVSFTFVFFLIFSLVCQADVRLVELERKVRALEQEKTLETIEGTLVNLRRYLNRPNSAFDRFEVLDILQALVRLARTQAHQKAEEYAAALDEVRARWDSLSSPELQRLLLGLLGDPVRAKVAKESRFLTKVCFQDVWSVARWTYTSKAWKSVRARTLFQVWPLGSFCAYL